MSVEARFIEATRKGLPVRLVYYQGKVRNFGDDINAIIWPKLAPELLEKDGDDGFLGIGTIIGITTSCSHLHIFSSGMGYDSLSGWSIPRTVWCVRGPLTAKLFGCSPDASLTDGAILAPMTLPAPPSHIVPRGVGVIPHWESLMFPGWRDACALAGMTLISPTGSPAEVRDQILSVELIVTESLHGAILADTYGIPWVAFGSSRNFSVFKWKDWAMSVDVPLDVMTLPPPSAMPLLRFGRPASSDWGRSIHYDEDAALREYSLRFDGPPRPSGTKSQITSWMEQSNLTAVALDRLLSLSPARTAEMLARAARQKPSLSKASLRESIQQRMLDRLARLCQLAGVNSLV